jgi:predicted RNA-binding Zn-ribbon protein involved in translation (DUF1610 family)
MDFFDDNNTERGQAERADEALSACPEVIEHYHTESEPEAALFAPTNDELVLVENPAIDADNERFPCPVCSGMQISRMYYAKGKGFIVRWECNRCEYMRVL